MISRKRCAHFEMSTGAIILATTLLSTEPNFTLKTAEDKPTFS